MPSPDESPLLRAAAEWVVRHDRGLTAAEAVEFDRWLAADGRHGMEFARLEAGWRALDRIAAVPSLAALAEAAEAAARARRARRRVWAATAGAAGVAAVLMVVALWGWRVPGAPAAAPVVAPGRYLVLSSTVRRLTLADGSVAELNGDSGVVPDFVPAERRVKLVRGEAHFHVAKNPARPFIVSAGPITVHAVGTAFDVRLAPEAIEVLVTEGKVALASSARLPTGVSLVAGERAVVHLVAAGEPSVTVDRPAARDLDDALAWESTRLVFDQTPLAQVVEAFNRFNVEQLILPDSALGARTLTGTFRADNLDAFTRLLRASVDVVAQPAANGRIVLRPAAP